MKLVKDFMEGRAGLDRINYSQLVLIPKNQSSSTVKEFRPIALLNSSVKIISKILANRLSLLLTKLIGDYQSGFIKGHNILKGVVEMHEIIHQTRKTRQGRYMLKLDFEKAYNMMDWACLIEVLKQRGFRDRWITWIRSWLVSAKCHILLNGERSKETVCR